MVSAQQSKSASELSTRQFPGAFGSNPNTRRLAGKLEDLAGGTTTSPFLSPLERAIREPSFQPRTAAQETSIEDLINKVGGTTAARGLGAPTQVDIASNVAPALQNIEQENINRLQEAFIGDVTGKLGEKEIDVGALGEFIELALPQIVSGQRTSGKGAGGSISGGGVSSLFSR